MAHERGYIDDVELLDEISGLVENPKSLEKMILKHQSDPLNTLDPWSKRKIGVRYLYGDDGYKQNFDKAIQYLTIADNELSDKACMKSTMGKYYEFTGDYNLAFNAYEKAYDIYVNDLFNPCNCSVGYLAHAYYNGIGVEKNVDYAKELVLSGINKLGINCSNSVIYLYAYFALKGEKDFDLNQAAKLLSSTHTFDRYEISKFVMLRQIYLKLGKNTKDVDLYIKRCLKFASKSAIKYYKENIKKEVSYPYFGDF
jgi:tetratricopeptide (TPR) repeat protein